MIIPQRIQRRRVAGWKMPAGARYVGRPTVYGNPFNWQKMQGATECDGMTEEQVKALAVQRFRQWATEMLARNPAWLAPLRGHDLTCWCAVGQPCHADVLLELANPAVSFPPTPSLPTT